MSPAEQPFDTEQPFEMKVDKPRVRIRGASFQPWYWGSGSEIMTGYPENHPDTRLNNGKLVYTSRILKKSDSEVETLNTIYELIPGDSDGPGEEDGPWAEGWTQRSAAGPAIVGISV